MGFFGRLFKRAPSVQGVRFKQREVTNGNTYEVYTAPSRKRALEFLRAVEISRERKYVVVETPEGSLGKDLIMIFEEANGHRIEFGVRKPLPKPKKSRTHCARCGYPVLPAGREPAGVNVTEFVVLDEMKAQGVGFYCSACRTCWCPFCVSADSLETCQLCGARMDLCRE